MGIFDNMRKPKGKLGQIQLKSMNKEHTPVALWGLKHLNIQPNDIILDIGCGGGINIKRMADKAKKVYGIDYSQESVKVSKQVNKNYIKEEKVEILNGNVSNLPFEDNTFDIITAFETVYFWPDLEENFKEVKRVLKPGGIFLIVMESNGSGNIPMKIAKLLINMTLYDDNQLTNILKKNNYSDITVYLRDGLRKQEIIKSEGTVKRLKDDYSHISITDKFMQWITVTARK